MIKKHISVWCLVSVDFAMPAGSFMPSMRSFECEPAEKTGIHSIHLWLSVACRISLVRASLTFCPITQHFSPINSFRIEWLWREKHYQDSDMCWNALPSNKLNSLCSWIHKSTRRDCGGFFCLLTELHLSHIWNVVKKQVYYIIIL